MIRVSLLSGGTISQGGAELIDRWSPDRGDRLWIDIEGPTQDEIEPLLEERFRFHELAAEDALSESTLPKYDRFASYDFFVFRALDMNLIEHGIATMKLAAFLSDHFVFTIHPDSMVSVNNIWERCPQDTRILEQGTDFLLYSVLDVLVDLHFPLIEEIEEMVDEIQHLIFTSPNQSLLDELLKLKRDLNQLRRYTLPQRDLFNSISRGDAKFIAPDHLIYFRDLYDHMFRIAESIDVERDLVAGTMEAYLSVIANRTNDIMKVLTVFSAILLPANLIAGIFGMNFTSMPLHWRYGFPIALSAMAFMGMSMLLYFVQKGWIWSKRDLSRLRRTGYKRISWPVRYARHIARKATRATLGL